MVTPKIKNEYHVKDFYDNKVIETIRINMLQTERGFRRVE